MADGISSRENPNRCPTCGQPIEPSDPLHELAIDALRKHLAKDPLADLFKMQQDARDFRQRLEDNPNQA